MIRLLGDADFNQAIVKGAGVTNLQWTSCRLVKQKLEGVPDPDVLALAAGQDRILVTDHVGVYDLSWS